MNKLFFLMIAAYSVCLYADNQLIERSVSSSVELQDAINDAAVNATHSTKIQIKGTLIGNFVVPATNYEIILEGIKDSPTLNGGGTGSTLTIDAGARVEVLCLTICDGIATDGGGILNNGDLKVRKSRIRDNIASNNGGGIYNSSTAILNLKDSEILDNRAESGGGIFSLGTMKVHDTLFTGNLSILDGGALVNISDPSTTMRIQDCKFKDNVAQRNAGAIYTEGTLVVKKSTFKENVADSIAGAIFNVTGSLSLKKVVIKSNSSINDEGGGVYNNGFLTIKEQSVIRDNSALLNGGGILNNGQASIRDSEIKRNTAVFAGGGIYNTSNATLYINRSTINKNQAEAGGGIANVEDAVLTVKRTSIFENSALVGGGIYTTSSVPVTITKSKIIKNEPDNIAP